MATAAERQPEAHQDVQDGLFDRIIENDMLAAALERREKANDAKKTATRKYEEAHDAVKAQLAALNIEDDEVVRCGRFRIKKTVQKGRSVAFETGESSRLTISLLDAS